MRRTVAPIALTTILAQLARQGRACGGVVCWTNQAIAQSTVAVSKRCPTAHLPLVDDDADGATDEESNADARDAAGTVWRRCEGERIGRRARWVPAVAPVAVDGGNDRASMRWRIDADESTFVIGVIGRAEPRVVLSALHGAGLAQLAGVPVRLLVSPEARRATRSLEGRFRLDGLVSDAPTWDAAALAPVLDVAVVLPERPAGGDDDRRLLPRLVRSMFRDTPPVPAQSGVIVQLDAGASGAMVIGPGFADPGSDHEANAEGRRLAARLAELHARRASIRDESADSDVETARRAADEWAAESRARVCDLLAG